MYIPTANTPILISESKKFLFSSKKLKNFSLLKAGSFLDSLEFSDQNTSIIRFYKSI